MTKSMILRRREELVEDVERFVQHSTQRFFSNHPNVQYIQYQQDRALVKLSNVVELQQITMDGSDLENTRFNRELVRFVQDVLGFCNTTLGTPTEMLVKREGVPPVKVLTEN